MKAIEYFKIPLKCQKSIMLIFIRKYAISLTKAEDRYDIWETIFWHSIDVNISYEKIEKWVIFQLKIKSYRNDIFSK